jgi:hypothetical protein
MQPMLHSRWRLMLIACVVGACFPSTTRPPFPVEPSAPVTDIALTAGPATRAIALALDADSIPVRRTEARDGWLETDWFDVHTMKPTTQRRLGPDVVKVRAFVEPSSPNHSTITVETVYRPLADPSTPPRALEQQVPVNHPVAGKVLAALNALAVQYGGVAAEPVNQLQPKTLPKVPGTVKPVARPDSAVKHDSSTATRPDTGHRVPPDTSHHGGSREEEVVNH